MLKNAAHGPVSSYNTDIVNPMDTASVFAISFAIGVIAGLRSLTAPAVVSWAAYLGWLNVRDTWAAFLSRTATVYIFTALALAELVSDKLPRRRAGRLQGRSLPGLSSAQPVEQPSARPGANLRSSELCWVDWARWLARWVAIKRVHAPSPP